MEVKICGITNVEDALMAVEEGADALGFLFYPPSPRHLRPRDAFRIMERLPARVCKVGVFVDKPPQKVRCVFNDLGLDLVQFHGHEDPEYLIALADLPSIKVIRGEQEELQWIENYEGLRAVLLDGFDPRLHRSTGRLAHWHLAPRIRARHRLILAGGLTEGNLAEAVRATIPDAVDVSSGLEKSPGRKDREKVKGFMRIAIRISGSFPGRSVFKRWPLCNESS